MLGIEGLCQSYINQCHISYISYYVISIIDTFAMWRTREDCIVVMMTIASYVIDVN